MFLITVIAIVLMFVVYQRKNQGKFGAVSFLMSLYIVMCMSALVLYFFFDYDSLYNVQFEPMLYLSLCLCISFFGVFNYSDKRITILIIDNWKLLHVLEIFQIVTSMMAIVFFLPFAIQGLTGDVAQNRQDVQFFGTGMESYGILNSIFSIFGNLFVVSILLSFINFATIGAGGSRLRGKILLSLSGVYIIYVLAYVGRDSLVYWLFSFLFIYLIIKDFIPSIEQREIMKLFRRIAAAALIPFVLITLARFSSQSDTVIEHKNSELFSIFDYTGQQFFDFNDQYLADAPPMNGMVNFGQILDISSAILGTAKQKLDRYEMFDLYGSSGAIVWRFSTFVGSWLQDFGRMGTLIAVSILAISLRLSLRKQAVTGVLSFTSILYFIVLSQILLFGVFYYRQYGTSIAQLTLLFIAVLFSVFKGKGTPVIVTKPTAKKKDNCFKKGVLITNQSSRFV